MPEVFADTAGWANFFVRTEPFHAQAVQLMQQWHTSQTSLITTNYVLTELVALFTSPLRVPRVEQIRIIETIKAASWVELVHIDAELDAEAWQLLKRRQDKLWSLKVPVNLAERLADQRSSLMRTTDQQQPTIVYNGLDTSGCPGYRLLRSK